MGMCLCKEFASKRRRTLQERRNSLQECRNSIQEPGCDSCEPECQQNEFHQNEFRHNEYRRTEFRQNGIRQSNEPNRRSRFLINWFRPTQQNVPNECLTTTNQNHIDANEDVDVFCIQSNNFNSKLINLTDKLVFETLSVIRTLVDKFV